MDLVSIGVVVGVVVFLVGVLAILFREKESSYSQHLEEREKVGFEETDSSPKAKSKKRGYGNFRDRNRAKKKAAEPSSGDDETPDKQEPVKVAEKVPSSEPPKKPAASAATVSKAATAAQPGLSSPPEAKPKPTQQKKTDVAKPKSDVVDGGAASKPSAEDSLKPEDKRSGTAGNASPKAPASPRVNTKPNTQQAKGKSQPPAKSQASSSQPASKSKPPKSESAAVKVTNLRISVEEAELSKDDCDELIAILQQKQGLAVEWTKKGSKGPESASVLKQRCDTLTAQLEEERRTNRDNMQVVTNKKAELLEEIRKAKIRLTDSQRIIAQKDKDLQFHSQRIRDLESAESSKKSNEQAEETTSLQEQISRLKQQLKEAEARPAPIASSKQDDTSAKKELEAKCRRLEQECAEMRKELQQKPAAATSVTNDDLQFEQKVWEGRVKAVEKEKSALAHQLAELERQVAAGNAVSEDNLELLGRCETAEQRREEAENQLKETLAMLDRFKERLSDDEQQAQRREQEQKDIRTELEKERQALHNARAKEKEALEKVGSLQAQVDQQVTQIRTLEEVTAEKTQLEERIAELESRKPVMSEAPASVVDEAPILRVGDEPELVVDKAPTDSGPVLVVDTTGDSEV